MPAPSAIEPGETDFIIYQGATFSRVITWTADGSPVNLTGYSARMQFRTDYADNSGTIALDLTTSGGGIVLGGAAGTITVTATGAQTAAITALGGHYDLELYAGGGEPVYRLLMGDWVLSQEVTR